MKKTLITLGVLLSVMANAPALQAGQTLHSVKMRESVKCGVNTGESYFSRVDQNQNWIGIDVDYCRAIAAAVLGDASKARFEALDYSKQLSAVTSNQIDVLASNPNWTEQRLKASNTRIAAYRHQDSYAVMIRKTLGVTNWTSLDGARLCVINGSVSEQKVTDWFGKNHFEYVKLDFDRFSYLTTAQEQGRCDASVGILSELHSIRLLFAKPDNYVVLKGPPILGSATFGPMINNDDLDWNRVVEAVHHAQLRAEELGVTSKNVDEMRQSTDPDVQKLLGVTGDVGTKLGLSPYWAYEVIRQVGNYGEIFDKNNKNYGIQRASQNILTQKGKNSASPFY